MIIKLVDHDTCILIAGFRKIKVKDVKRFFQAINEKTDGTCIQFFDASLVAGWEHIYFAALNALNAFKSKLSISSSLAMETLLYASAQRQIKDAVNLMGIKPNTQKVAVLIWAKTPQQAKSALNVVSRLLSGKPDDSVVKLTDEKKTGLMEFFNISALELEAKMEHKGFGKQALSDLIIEHVALLVTKR
jgi:tRNA threonylcarbamoyladenosine modification (KEOPS) complex Cgi121 subunit